MNGDEQLALAIELVRHRGLQKRVNDKDPEIPKLVKPTGKDWKPCQICTEEAKMILNLLR